MAKLIKGFFFIVILSLNGISDCDEKKAVSISINKLNFLYRWSSDIQFEFTPVGQEDLTKWTDMVTLISFQNVKNKQALTNAAAESLKYYESQKGIVIKAKSIPEKAEVFNEHLIIVVLGTKEFTEVVFARFKMEKEIGVALLYSHRIYGPKIGDEVSKWIKENGPVFEKEIFNVNEIPSIKDLEKNFDSSKIETNVKK